MKFLHWFLNKAGKASLSALQMAGLAAALLVAGVAAYQLLSPGDINPDTVFSSADEEVVYVASGAGSATNPGAGGSFNYGDGGEARSGIRTRLSRDMQLMNLDAERVKNPPATKLERDEAEVNSYQADGAMSGSGLGGNGFSSGAAGDPMLSAQDSIAQIQAIMAAQQAAMQNGDVEGGSTSGAAGAASGAGSRGGKFGGGQQWGNMAQGMAHASGNNLGSTPLQAAGGASSRGGSLGGGEGAGREVSASTDLNNSRTPMLQLGRDVVLGQEKLGNAKDLESLRKLSAKVAAHANRSDNEASRIFLASSHLSGGISLSGEEQVNMEGGTSDDFNDISSGLSRLAGWAGELQSTYERYQSAANNLVTKLRQFRNQLLGCSVLGPLFSKLCGIPFNNKIKRKINEFRNEWGDYEVEKNNTEGPFADKIAKIRSKMWHSFGWFDIITELVKNFSIYGASNKDINTEEGVIYNGDFSGDTSGMANDGSGNTGGSRGNYAGNGSRGNYAGSGSRGNSATSGSRGNSATSGSRGGRR